MVRTEPDSAAVDDVDDEADLSERPVSELKGSDLEYSTCTPEPRAPKDNNECIFCGKKYSGTLREIRCHMVKLSPDSKSLVAKYKPNAQWAQRQTAVAAEMKKRFAESSQKAATDAARSVARDQARASTGAAPNGGAGGASSSDAAPAMFKVVTADDCDKQFARVVAKNNLSTTLSDEQEFRKFLTMVAKSGKRMLKSTNKPGEMDTALCHRTKLSGSAIPSVDKALDEKIGKKVEKQAALLGCSGAGDGWTDPNHQPMMHFMQNVPAGSRFVAALNTSGHRKDARYQDKFALDSMKASGGIKLYWMLAFDGACKSPFKHIEEEATQVSCVIDPAHSVDNYAKNVCSNKVCARTHPHHLVG
jgi:hypothetical protein